MGWRFRRSIGLGKFLRINLSKGGLGVSAGVPGARVGIGPRGRYTSVGVPGTGLYNITYDKDGTPKPVAPDNSGDIGNIFGSLVRVALALVFCIIVFSLIVAGLSTSNDPAPAQKPPTTPAPALALPLLFDGSYYITPINAALMPSIGEPDKQPTITIPAGGVFQFTQEMDVPADLGTWYAAQTWDASKRAISGYLKADQFAGLELSEWTPPPVETIQRRPYQILRDKPLPPGPFTPTEIAQPTIQIPQIQIPDVTAGAVPSSASTARARPTSPTRTSTPSAAPVRSTSPGSPANNEDAPTIQRPAGVPSQKTCQCKDGSYSETRNRQGACSGHNGVRAWFR